MTSARNVSSIYQRPAELLQRLIQFDTTNPLGNESECISFINGLLTEAEIETSILSHTPERPNLIARLYGQGKASPLLLYGHVDVVTTGNQKWQHPPFEGKVADGFVYDGTATVSTYSTIDTISVSGALERRTARIKILINDLTDKDGFVIRLHRDATSGNVDDTLASNIVLTHFEMTGYFWRP